MNPDNLISYNELLRFLKEKGKDKNWFDTLRARHKLIHKPIIKPPIEISSHKTNLRQGRDVFYLAELKPLLLNIIDLHDSKGLTYEEIRNEMKGRFMELVRKRNSMGYDDKRTMPVSFYNIYRIAQVKLQEFFGWEDNSIEMNFYDQILKTRLIYGQRYQGILEKIHELLQEKKNHNAALKELKEEKELLGFKIDYYQEIIRNVITMFSDLLKTKKIIMTEKDWQTASTKADIRRERG
jgi:hypothetical protein